MLYLAIVFASSNSLCISCCIPSAIPIPVSCTVNHSALQVQSLILRHECLMYVLT
ncbi:hypothetical protein [Candidatus Tisiphia endosymbiont of Parasteatoda lunata]|uniref:hypothetical protein n=1 Tax=Candidatus Tisiphia endosymbiont of Parasteatoda lunata TaxID=3066275 RepID=UPI00313B2BFE